MYQISIHIGISGEGSFELHVANRPAVRINVTLRGEVLILRETILSAKKQAKANIGRLLYEIVEYARMHALKIITLSRVIQQKFHQNARSYQDVWESS